MKKLKYAFWLVLVGIVGLLVYQNLAYFTARHSLHIDLGIYQRSTPELANGAIIAIFVGIGVLITMIFYFASRYESYRAKKTVKDLRSSMEENSSVISGLKQEVELLKSGARPPIQETPEEETAAQEEGVASPETKTAQTTEI